MKNSEHVERQTLHLAASSGMLRVEDARLRMIGLAMFFVLGYVLLSIRLVEVTLADRSFIALASETMKALTSVSGETVAGVRMMGERTPQQHKSWEPAVPAMVLPRQSIRDRHGVLLASSVPSQSLYARPDEIESPETVAARIMQIIPGINRTTLLRRLNSSARFVWIKRHLTPQEQEALLWAGIPGLYFHSDYHRIYPHGRLMSHVLGYVDVDGQGLAGVEKYFNESLGRDDALKPLYLSMDVRLQEALHVSLEKTMHHFQAIAAAGAVFHIPTSQTMAMVSLPDYDPNRPLEYQANDRFNRMSVGQYELGSIFKALSLAMVLEHGKLDVHDGFDATQPIVFGGSRISDFKPKKRWLSVPEIFVYSSNIGTVKMIDTLSAGAQRDFLTRMGMFAPVDIELHERSVPVTRKTWKPIERATISYGHGISVTPLHLLRGMLAVTGGGEFRELTLVKDKKKPSQMMMQADVSRQVNRLMRAVVQHGTASKAEVPGYAVGAKTGTADKAVAGGYHHSKKISSIVTAFPMPNPEYLVFVMFDEPEGTKETFNYATAGWVAAPAAAQVIRDMTHVLGMPPQPEAIQDDIDHMIVTAAERAKARKHHYVRRASY